MTETPASNPLKSWALVILQFSLLGTLLLLSEIRHACLPCWGLIIASGVLGSWAIIVMGHDNFNVRPDVKADARLVHEHLPYTRIRHPMYTSVLLLALGLLLSPWSWLKLGLFAALLGVMSLKAAYEERLLLEKFPNYAAYQARTQRFIPFVY